MCISKKEAQDVQGKKFMIDKQGNPKQKGINKLNNTIKLFFPKECR